MNFMVADEKIIEKNEMMASMGGFCYIVKGEEGLGNESSQTLDTVFSHLCKMAWWG